MTSTVLLSKLEYSEKTQNLQTQWLRGSRGLYFGSTVSYTQHVVCKYLLMKTKSSSGISGVTCFQIQLNKIYLIYILEVYVYNLHTHNLLGLSFSTI